MKKVTIYTDGSARGNPDGPGGYWTVLQYVDGKGVLHEREYSAGYRKTTNNRMEMMAVIVGLEALTRPCEVEIVSDSKYVTDAFNQHWIESWLKKNWKTSGNKPVKNIDLLFGNLHLLIGSPAGHMEHGNDGLIGAKYIFHSLHIASSFWKFDEFTIP